SPPSSTLFLYTTLFRSLVKENAARLECPMRSHEVIRQPLSSDVFGHSNAYDCIVKLAAAPGNFAIIAQFDLRLVCQSSLCNPGARPFRLRRAQSDSLGVHAKMFRSVNDERAPATTDIEETLACSGT